MILAERRRYEERFRALFADGVAAGEGHPDLDAGAAALLVLSAANWAYMARRRTRHRRARRPLHRDPRRRHPRLRDAPVNALLLVNPWATGVAEEQLKAVRAVLPRGRSCG